MADYEANKNMENARSSFFMDANDNIPSSSPEGSEEKQNEASDSSSDESYASGDETPSYDNYNEVYSEFPLHRSVELGNIKQVKEILTNSPSLLDQVDSEFRTALHIATMKGNFEIVSLLLNLGADLTITTRDKYYATFCLLTFIGQIIYPLFLGIQFYTLLQKVNQLKYWKNYWKRIW